MNEGDIRSMAELHYRGSPHVVSGFSSWASSLHPVLSHAHSRMNCGNTHIAIMDTEELDDDVHVWHVPNLLGPGWGSHEYLAYGRIRGPGYRAVPLDLLINHALLEQIFPELTQKDWTVIFGGIPVEFLYFVNAHVTSHRKPWPPFISVQAALVILPSRLR
jgi:hypothetical protein